MFTYKLADPFLFIRNMDITNPLLFSESHGTPIFLVRVDITTYASFGRGKSISVFSSASGPAKCSGSFTQWIKCFCE